MKSFFSYHRYYFLLLFVYLLAELFVNPTGNYPLNDDWSYASSVLKLEREGKVDIGDWPAMTLVTHILWGFIFTKAFGFSFVVLRVSTWVSVIIGMFFLNKLVRRISGNDKIAFVSCAIVLFNPVYFNVSNSFMTDANFLTLIILCCYFGYDFLVTQKPLSYILTFIFAIALTLLRQYGIIVPVCMVLCCLFLPAKRNIYVILSVVLTVAVYAILLWYESYLKTILPSYASYKFSGNINPTRRLFWDYLFYGISTRYKIIMIHVFFYVFPLIIVFLPGLIKTVRIRVVVILSVIVFPLIYFLYKDYPLQVGNVFLDTAVGADTTYETLKGTYGDAPHFYSRIFENLITPFKYLLISLSILTLLLFIIKNYKTFFIKIRNNLPVLFFISLFLAYSVLILITESFFDRYQLPVIGLAVMIFSFFSKNISWRIELAIIPLLFFCYFSVAGTRDYFQWNDRKWEAYYDLMNNDKIPQQKINGGFEVNSWNMGKPEAWYKFMLLHEYDYLIQFKREDSFAVMKEYPFQRFFPYKKDTLRVYKRTIFSKSATLNER